jgi:hypothetical protein
MANIETVTTVTHIVDGKSFNDLEQAERYSKFKPREEHMDLLLRPHSYDFDHCCWNYDDKRSMAFDHLESLRPVLKNLRGHYEF